MPADPAGECLVRVGGANVEKRVAAPGSEYLGNDSFHGCPFVNGRGTNRERRTFSAEVPVERL
jgi:hypothetical protein